MKFRVKRLSFLKALQLADRAVPGRTTKDILKNVKLSATTNQILLTGTDSEIGLRVEVSDVIHSDGGECLLPTARLIQVLTELDDDENDFKVESGRLWIRGKKSEFQFLTEDPGDFPDVADFKDDAFFQMKASDLRRLVRRTIFATDTESTRYALGGVQVEFNRDKRVNFVATDSRRLAIDSAPFEAVGPANAPDVPPVIPNKAMKLLLAVAEDVGEVQIALHKNDIAIRCGLVTMTTRLVEGRFPDWRKVVPSKFSFSIDFVVGPLLGAIRQAMIMRNEESRSVEFSISKGQLRLKADVKDMGASKVDIPIGYEGEPLKIRFDPAYFADYLKALEPGSVLQWNLIGVEEPALLESNGYRYLIMPLSKD